MSKDGGDRTLLTSNLFGVAPPLRLMVDSQHVHVVSHDRLSRVVLGEQGQETLLIAVERAMPLVAARDDDALYYAGGRSLYRFGKSDFSFPQRLLTLDAGVITSLAVDGTDLYFSVSDADAPRGSGWVGRLECEVP